MPQSATFIDEWVFDRKHDLEILWLRGIAYILVLPAISKKLQMIFVVNENLTSQPRMKKYLPTASLLRLLFFYLVFQSAPAFSQEGPASSHSSLAEKVYLQLDNKVYTTDQTIWFKAIVANAALHTPSQISGVLYAELIDESKNIVERKLIKIEKGIADGFFQLSPAYAHGIYQVRAYTEWNKNFGTAFFFQEYILVSGAQKEAPYNAIKRLTIMEGQRNERRLNVQLDPSLSDSISGKAIRFV
ncbi:MAG: hypothetical protein J7502_17075, partial [Flavisolibacter sp.]|nr:hypothetical protein [Flavisolibacter sp.]